MKTNLIMTRRLSPNLLLRARLLVCAAVALVFFFRGLLRLIGGRLLRSGGLLLFLVSAVGIPVWFFLRTGLDQIGDYGTADTD